MPTEEEAVRPSVIEPSFHVDMCPDCGAVPFQHPMDAPWYCDHPRDRYVIIAVVDVAECERRVAQAREAHRAFVDGLTASLNRRGVPACPSWEAALDALEAQAREGYWPADEVLEELRTETDFYEGKVGGSQEKQDGYALGFYEAADFLERRRFSGEGAS